MDELSYLNELFAEIEARRSASPDTSYSAQLLADLPRAANKLGEEAVETVTAALTGFPGRANTSIFFPRASFFNLTSANVSGFPGFIITLPN